MGTRSPGSQIRLSTLQNGEHHVTVPAHNPLKVGTLGGILAEISDHFGVAKKDLQAKLFG